MTITVAGAERPKVPALASITDPVFTNVVAENDTTDVVEFESTLTSTPNAQVVAGVVLDGSTNVLTAAAPGDFSVVRVGDVVSGGTGIQVGSVVQTITPSPDGVAPDTLTLDLVTTVAETASLTFTGAAVTDPVLVTRYEYTITRSNLEITPTIYVFDGSTQGAASPYPVAQAVKTVTLQKIQVNLDTFYGNQRVDSPT